MLNIITIAILIIKIGQSVCGQCAQRGPGPGPCAAQARAARARAELQSHMLYMTTRCLYCPFVIYT